MLMLRQDLMVGEEASELRAMLDVKYPMENGQAAAPAWHHAHCSRRHRA